MATLGLTGGIGSGKTTVSNLLAEAGWHVIDTDRIAREMCVIGHEGYKNVVDAFGTMILNNNRSINRAVLGRIIFETPEKRKLLNSILHPLIRAEWHSQLNRHKDESPSIPAVVVIPLLYETGAEQVFDSVVCVACSREIQMSRLKERGLTSEDAILRIQTQHSMEDKMKQSQFVLWNNGNLGLLKQQVNRFKNVWISKTRK
ncbi:MAG: dephospho-CoA kinase [Verrucomicrobiota bacterium]